MSENNNLAPFPVAVLTVSDTRTAESDLSGPALVEELKKLGFVNIDAALVKDEQADISKKLIELAECHALILSTGGTGFTPRDVTPEATAEVLEKRAASLSEVIRAKGMEKTPYAALSRAIAGIRGDCLIINLPGSPKGAVEGIEAVSHLLYPILVQITSGHCPAE